MIDRKLARPLVATFLVAVITFLAGSGYTQLYRRKIDGDVDVIAHNASPSIQHATHVRISLRELRLALADAVHTAEVGGPADPRRFPRPRAEHRGRSRELFRCSLPP